MAVDGVSPALAIRSSVGIELWASLGPKLPYEHKSELPREETKNSRSISFSPEGRYFAYTNGQEIKVLRTCDWLNQCVLARPKAFYLKFSPQGNYLCTWELYTVSKDGSPNMFVYEIATGNEVFSIIQKNQTDWEPSWSIDESIFAMVVGGEALFYDLSQGISGFKSTSCKIGGSRGGMLSLGPGTSPPYIAIYTPGTKGAPSSCKLYKYPALGQNQTIALKNFFNADRVDMLWSKRGTGLLIFTSTEVDKTGASYYGNQALHFMGTNGDTCSVVLNKEGPVHCVKWSPKATEFIVVYGFMQSKAALYNLKCNVVFDFGEGPRNCAYFNPFGNLVVLAGFGNLPGNVEIWDVKKKEQIANIKCPDTTYFEWNPNGEYFVTATTAPRLRIGNGFKVYHYSGALMHETIWPEGQELLGLEWQKFPNKTFAEPVITKVKQEGIKSSQPEASKKVYTPPHLRLIKEGKNPEKYVPQPQTVIPGLSAGSTAQSNKKAALKVNQKNNKQKFKKESNLNGATGTNNSVTNKVHTNVEGMATIKPDNADQEMQQQYQNQHQHKSLQQPKQQQHQHQAGEKNNMQQATMKSEQVDGATSIQTKKPHPKKEKQMNYETAGEGQQTSMQPLQLSQQPPKKTVNAEKEKKIRNVAKKLSDIKKLKARQDQGETLELNQLNKISMEAKFLEELKALKLSA